MTAAVSKHQKGETVKPGVRDGLRVKWNSSLGVPQGGPWEGVGAEGLDRQPGRVSSDGSREQTPVAGEVTVTSLRLD